MSYPVAPGVVGYGSDSASAFVPQIWSSKWAVKFYKETFLPEITNSDYEGEIKKYGDEVIIRVVPDVDDGEYVVGEDLTYNRPSSSKVTLKINRGRKFTFPIDNVIERQADVDYVEKLMGDGARKVKISLDRIYLSEIYPSASSYNKGLTAGKESLSYDLGVAGTPKAIDKTNALEAIVDCESVLGEANATEDTFIIVPGWYANLLKKGDIKNASVTGDSISPMRNGRLGQIAGFGSIYVTNCYTKITTDASGKTCYPIIFGSKKACTFAAQMTMMETIPNPKDFGQLVRSLIVYGFECINSEGLGVLYCYKA